VDLKRDHQLSFVAELRCRPGQAGQRLPVTLQALVGREQVAAASATAQCGQKPAGTTGTPDSPDGEGGRPAVSEPQPPVPFGTPQPPPQGGLVPPLLPPAVPAPIGGTAPAGASAPATAVEPGVSASAGQSPASAGTPAAAVGHAAEDDPQLATASLQMTSRSRDPSGVQPWIMLAAGMITAAAAHAHRSRTRRQHPTVRNRIR
jgi:hypothetical protein